MKTRGADFLLSPVLCADLEDSIRSTLKGRNSKFLNQITDASESKNLSLAAEQLPQTSGHTDKTIFVDASGQRYLYKRMSRAETHKVFMVTSLANLCGLDTPIGQPMRCEPSEVSDRILWESNGALFSFIEGCDTAKDFPWDQASPSVISHCLISRWFNQFVGNQDVWWGQFLTSATESERSSNLTNIDFDDAFLCRSPSWLQHVLQNHFGIHADKKDTAWRSEHFRFERPVGFSPDHYDSKFTLYGRFFYYFVQTSVDIDLAALTAWSENTLELDQELVAAFARSYAESLWLESQGYIQIKASKDVISPTQFVDEFCARFYRSIREYQRFIEELVEQRRVKAGSMYEHFLKMEGIDY